LHPLRSYLYDSFGWRYRGKSVPPPGLHLLSATRMISSPSQLWRCDGHLSGEGFRGLQFDIHEVFARSAELPIAHRFEVYSDDQVESRALLTLDFMERLLEMDRHPRYRNIQLGFIAGRIYVAIPSRDILRFGCDTKCIAPEQAATKVIGEMKTIFDILSDIDVLQASAGQKPILQKIRLLFRRIIIETRIVFEGITINPIAWVE